MAFDREGFYHEVGLRLRLHRENRDLTQEDLADVLGMPRSTYANIERGRQRAPADVLWRVAVYMGLSVADFLPRPSRNAPMPKSESSHAMRSSSLAPATTVSGETSDSAAEPVSPG